MINESDRRILAAACGLEWLELTAEMDTLEMVGKHRPSFTTPDDWELVRTKVVIQNVGAFTEFMGSVWFNKDPVMLYLNEWWLTLSPEECCELVADFILANSNLFPENAKAIIEQEVK